VAPSGDEDSASDDTVVTVVDDKTALFISGLALSVVVVELTVVVTVGALAEVVAMLSVVVVELTVLVTVGVVDRKLLHLSDAQHDRDVFTFLSGHLSSAGTQRFTHPYWIAHTSP